MKVLFLSSSMGGGHGRTAEAVLECLERRDPAVGVMIVDALKYISPLVDRLVAGSYLNAVKNAPGIYGCLYDLSERGHRLSNLTKAFNRLLSPGLVSLIEGCRPDVIVCTHSFPLQMLSSLKTRGLVEVPVIGIVTDFVNHPFWKLGGIDAFIVAHHYIKSDMIRMGIPGDRIYTSGIPVLSRFLVKRDRLSVLGELGLQNRPTVLLMGGSLGFGKVRDVFTSLLKSGRDLQIIAVAGHNDGLKLQLEKLSEGTRKNVRVLGFTERISELMDISDFIITKPGGVTISEALVKRLPILVAPPIPGQEVRNARFLVNMGAAVQLVKDFNMDDIFAQVLDNPTRVRHMKEMAFQLAKPNAGEDLADLIEEAVSKPVVFTAGITS